MFNRGFFRNFKNYNIILSSEEGKGALILGDYQAAIDTQLLESLGVTAVLTTAYGLNIYYPNNQFVHKVYNAFDIDSYRISQHFDDSFRFIDANLSKGSVYVHCAAGISRSASIVIYYLMRKFNWCLEEAFKYVQRRRSIICPNPGFMRQLRVSSASLQKYHKMQTISNFKQLPTIYQSSSSNQAQQQQVKKVSPTTQSANFGNSMYRNKSTTHYNSLSDNKNGGGNKRYSLQDQQKKFNDMRSYMNNNDRFKVNTFKRTTFKI